MPQSTSVTVKHEGRPIQLTFTSCRVFMAGEYAGNVELYIDCDRNIESTIQECLALQNPGEDTSEEFIATGGPDDGVCLVFSSDAIARLAEAPGSLTLLWCGEPISSIETTLAESVPLERVHKFIDPLQILERPRLDTASRVRLEVQREAVWLIPAALMLAAGAALWAAPDGLMLEDVPFRQIAGSVLIAFCVAIGFVGYWIPYRQVWFDRDRRQLAILEGRTLSAQPSLADSTRCDVDRYAHVRLCERQYAEEISDESGTNREEWIVSLEGPIPYAFDDGRVHSRTDAHFIARFGSARKARRLAGEVGFYAGLPILEATDW